MSAADANRSRGGVHTVRRVITYTLLFVMVLLAAIGASGLFGRLLEAGTSVIADDTSGLAQSLAFTLIASPLAAVLWWLVWRGLTEQQDRTSVGWGIYLALASTVALIVSASALLTAAAALIAGRWLAGELATGLVWAAVWIWHQWMLRHPTKSPTRLIGVSLVIASFYGLVVGVGGAITALAQLLDTAAATVDGTFTVGAPWWQLVLQSLIWAAGGALIWWWHWQRRGVKILRSGFADVVLVVVTGLGAAGVCLAGTATTLYVLLRLALDPSDPVAERLDPIGVAVAAALIGAAVWSYHRGVVAQRSAAVRHATGLVTSGVSLAAAASGIGIIVNSILAAVGEPLAASGLRALLLGGVSALVVGGPVWWAFWRPRSQAEPEPGARAGRRVYLVAVFGVSALVALITLILIAFQLFELGLAQASGQSTLEQVRAPLGLLTATLLVAGYHFAIWWRDRPTPDTAARAGVIRRVILVAGTDSQPLRSWLEDDLGVSVTVWNRADAETDAVGPERLAEALSGIVSPRVLVVAGPGARLDVIPLEG